MNRLSSDKRIQEILSWASAVLILVFFVLITVGSYVKIKTAVVIVYSVIALGFLPFAFQKTVSEFVKSPMMILWIVYAAVGFLSTVLIEKSKDFYILISQVSFTWILFILTRFVRYEDFFRLFRPFVAVLILFALFQEVTGIYVFAFLKEGTQFALADHTHGILSIFEYRHYFGCYILLALFSLLHYPEKQKWLTAVYAALFLAAVILTYTRSIWLAFGAGAILAMIRLIPKWRKKRKEDKDGKGFRPTVRFWIVFGGILAALIVLTVVFRERLALVWNRVVGRFTVLNPNQDSWYNRMFTIINGPKYVFENWQKYLFIGAGSGSALEWLKNVEGARFRSAIDCQYVHTLIETGLIGLLSLLGMIGYSLVRFFRSKDRKIVLFSLEFVMIAVAFFFFEAVVVNSSVFALWVFVLVSLCDGGTKDNTAENIEIAEKAHVS